MGFEKDPRSLGMWPHGEDFGFSYPRILNGCLIEKRCLSI